MAKHILVVDDDQMVLRTMKSLLSDLGYGSFTTSSLEEALQYMNLNKGAIRLALIDTIMPGINSAALVKKLLKMKNDLIVLGFSGAPSDLSVGLLDAGAQQILKKPLGPQALKLVLAEHLRPHEKAA